MNLKEDLKRLDNTGGENGSGGRDQERTRLGGEISLKSGKRKGRNLIGFPLDEPKNNVSQILGAQRGYTPKE